MDMDIIALCDSREMEGMDHVQESIGKDKLINGLFENPPLRDVMRAMRGRKISFIFGDYFRFPPQYARRAYRAVAKHLLVALQRSGMLSPYCQVYLLYLKQHEGVENVFEGLTTDRTLDPTLVSERENPLYRATRTLFNEERLHKCGD